jgi:hypothetical protein
MIQLVNLSGGPKVLTRIKFLVSTVGWVSLILIMIQARSCAGVVGTMARLPACSALTCTLGRRSRPAASGFAVFAPCAEQPR